ncbi:MAG: thioredoxin fold domain-containing protein [Thermoanaerobaculia bacterium]
MSPPPDTPPTFSSHAGPAGLEVIWAPTVQAAQSSAREMRDGRILIFFTDADCGECDRMLKIIAPSTSFYSFTRDKVPVPVDVSTPAGLRLAQRMRVVGVPTWVVATPDLLECSRQEGVTTQQGWVETFVRGEREWAGYKRAAAAEAENPGDTATVYEVARQLFRRGAREQAEGRFRRLAADPNVGPETREQVDGYLASIDLDAQRFDEATKRLDGLIASAKDPQLRERAELRRADVEIARGRADLAAYRLRQFRKAHPDSPLAAEAQALLDALQKNAPADPASKEK